MCGGGGVSIAVPPSPCITLSRQGCHKLTTKVILGGGVVLEESAGFPNVEGPPSEKYIKLIRRRKLPNQTLYIFTIYIFTFSVPRTILPSSDKIIGVNKEMGYLSLSPSVS